MTAESIEGSFTQIRNIITRLQSPVPDLSTLLSLLCGPLSSLQLLPPPFTKYNTDPLPEGTVNLARHIPPLQRELLEHVVPTWETALVEEQKVMLLKQYFCPEPFLASPTAGVIALLAYSSLLSLPLTEYSIRLLAHLSTEYSVDKLHDTIYSSRSTESPQKQSIIWEDCLRNIAAVPGKVANAAGGKMRIPPELEQEKYFHNVSIRCEFLIFTLSAASASGTQF
jgi:telomere length regulation protein